MRIEDDATLELLEVLASRDDASEDLISDVVLAEESGLEIVTVPLRQGSCVRVKLGRGDYERKLAKLTAFWEQAVIGRSKKNLEWIDLRFDGQVVTKDT
jgi:cell division protein FtsQ